MTDQAKRLIFFGGLTLWWWPAESLDGFSWVSGFPAALSYSKSRPKDDVRPPVEAFFIRHSCLVIGHLFPLRVLCRDLRREVRKEAFWIWSRVEGASGAGFEEVKGQESRDKR